MKKLLLALLLILCNCVLFAQRFHGGVLAGVSASQVDGDSYAGYNKAGLQGGVFISTGVTSRIDAHLEIKYTARGARNPASSDNTGAYKLTLHYIDLPVILALGIKELGSFELGLVPGYLFYASGEKDAGEVITENLKKFDLGTLLGISVNITTKLAFHMRYSYSIFSIRDQESPSAGYSWLGKLLGHTNGDFNNYLTFGVYYQLK